MTFGFWVLIGLAALAIFTVRWCRQPSSGWE